MGAHGAVQVPWQGECCKQAELKEAMHENVSLDGGIHSVGAGNEAVEHPHRHIASEREH